MLCFYFILFLAQTIIVVPHVSGYYIKKKKRKTNKNAKKVTRNPAFYRTARFRLEHRTSNKLKDFLYIKYANKLINSNTVSCSRLSLNFRQGLFFFLPFFIPFFLTVFFIFSLFTVFYQAQLKILPLLESL